jgi:hypothetical protein
MSIAAGSQFVALQQCFIILVDKITQQEKKLNFLDPAYKDLKQHREKLNCISVSITGHSKGNQGWKKA